MKAILLPRGEVNDYCGNMNTPAVITKDVLSCMVQILHSTLLALHLGFPDQILPHSFEKAVRYTV